MTATFMALAGLFFSMIIQVIVPPLPAELIVIGAARQFGKLATTLVAGSGLYVGSVAVYFLGRYIHMRLARFFDRSKVQQVVQRIRRYETAILWIRILPYNPSDLISYAAGIVEMDVRKFLLITAVTSYSRTYALAALGMEIRDAKTLFVVGAILLVSALVGGVLLYGRRSEK